MDFITQYFAALIELINEMSPYLILGFLFAGILHVFFPKSKVSQTMGKNNLSSVLKAALLGIPLPLCSCGVIPTGISFYKNGASKGASVSFLISTPQTGVDSILVTYSLLGLPFAIIRPIVALFTGVLGGMAVNKEKDDEPVSNDDSENNETKDQGNKIVKLFKYAFVVFLQDISKWLVLGLALAALMAVLIPDNFFANYIDYGVVGMLIVLAASVPLYVCATGSVPIAAVLLAKGISPGAALVFLMAGPATNIATMTVIGNVMGRKTLIRYLASIVGGAIVFGLLIDGFLPREWFALSEHVFHGEHSHHLLPEWLKITSSITLGLLIINGYIQKYMKTKLKIVPETKGAHKTVKVEGMSCNHCKANVETNVGKIAGISEINADITSSIVEIYGDNINLEKVKETVESLGYVYKGTVDLKDNHQS